MDEAKTKIKCKNGVWKTKIEATNPISMIQALSDAIVTYSTFIAGDTEPDEEDNYAYTLEDLV